MSKYFVKCGVHVALIMILLILLFQAKYSKATSVKSSNSSNFHCSGGSSIHDCFLADDDDNDDEESLEFLMGLAATTTTLDINKALKDNKPVVDCGRGKSTKSCLPNPNDPKVGEHCYDNLYPTKNRACST